MNIIGEFGTLNHHILSAHQYQGSEEVNRVPLLGF